MAGPAFPLDIPLHPDLCILAQCGRRLLRQAHAPSPQARRVPLRRELQVAINRFVAETNADPNPSYGPPIQSASSPLSNEGNKR